jgi:hypothetical protein
MASPFTTEEGALLVAVERANGGELATLEQIIWTLRSLTPPGKQLEPAQFATSAGLLVEVGLVEYTDESLGLTPEGRKLLRRSGLTNDPRHVAHVTGLLTEIDELDMDRHELGDAPVPSEADVRRALGDSERIEETPGGVGTPVLGEEVPVALRGAILGEAWIPVVLPDDTGEGGGPPPPPEYQGAPAHPLLDRLFRRRRQSD